MRRNSEPKFQKGKQRDTSSLGQTPFPTRSPLDTLVSKHRKIIPNIQSFTFHKVKEVVTQSIITSKDLESECPICFTFMVEPVKFPNISCSHRFCMDCIKALFNSSIIHREQLIAYARCPMCIKHDTIIQKAQIYDILVIDQDYLAEISKEKQREYKEAFEALYVLRS